VLVIQQVAVEDRGELSTKPELPFYSPPHLWKEWINYRG